MTDTQQIKDKLDIVDFISEYIQLKPAGINHKGLCPFHGEKTPSFMASRERQSWHCFGCNKGGDIFTFLEEIEGMEFVEALRFLADRAGIQLEFRASEVNSSQKNRIKDINTQAARFFYNFLTKMDASRPALKYLEDRGLKQDTIEEWQIGFVPDQWDLLTKYLLKKGYSIDDLVASGLTIKRDNANPATQQGFYDRFRGRIMFPIWDVHDMVVGFTGRILVETEKSGGKYVNTPQTIVYDKSRVVFGLNKAKKEIKAKDLIVMVEGQMDVIACHQAGMKNVVATSGTALTEQQIKLLKRYSNNINMAYDADVAGQAAAKRGIDIALREGLDVKVIQIPDGKGKDPDDCIKNNPAVWFDCVKNAQGIMDWYFSGALKNKDLSDPKQKQAVADQLLPEISLIPRAVEQDHWLRELSSRLNVEVSVLREDLKRVDELNKKKGDKRYEIGDNKTKLNQKSKIKNPPTRLDLLAERLLMLILKFPKQNILNSKFNILHSTLSTSVFFPLYEAIKREYNKNNSIDIETLRALFQTSEVENKVDLLLMKGDLEYSSFSEKEIETEFEQLLAQIEAEWLKNKRKKIQNEIEQAEKIGDKEKIDQLLKEFQDINK